MTAPGYARMAPPAVKTRAMEDGTLYLECGHPLTDYPDRVGDWLDHWAAETPDAVYLADRPNGPGTPWRKISFSQAADLAARIGSGLLARGLGPARPVMVIAENSVDHALATLGAFVSGVPVAPVSPGYAEAGRDFTRLSGIFATLQPGLVLIGGRARFGEAAQSLDIDPGAVVDIADLADLVADPTPSSAFDAAKQAVGPDDIAKILFSSGSTGTPKGILNNHRMLCSNQSSLAGFWRFLDVEKPVIVDWLPWSHTYGGNHNFNMILRNGGTFYVDGGKPAPGLIEATLENLREISPTVYFNVPRGYDLLIGELEADRELAEVFFARLNAAVYAGAGLPRSLFDRLEKLADEVLGHGVPVTTGWGTTETAPLATMTHYPDTQPPNIGLPCPGTVIKLAPEQGRLEIRVKGPNITPGYLAAPELNQAAFDEEGFFRTGDAGLLVDPERPEAGLLFDGRLAENFKLGTGSWVNVGALRLAVLSHLTPLIQDCVITGEHRNEIGLMAFANWQACADEIGAATADPDRLRTDPTLAKALAARLGAYNEAHPAATTQVERAVLLDRPPSVDDGEITDKGYVNQQAVLNARAAQVAALYTDAIGIIRPG